MTHLLNLLAAIALLVWGTHLVRTGILRVFGANLRMILRKSTSNRFAAFLSGIGVTALVQSSTATALIVSSFVGQSFISMTAALAVMLGADVGTSLMAVVFSRDLSWLSPLFIFVGVVLFIARQSSTAGRVGRVLIGLGLMLLALQLVRESTAVLVQSPIVKTMLGSLGSDLLLEITIGAVLAIVSYSSLAVVLLTATLAHSGIVPIEVALGLVLGANLGSGCLAVLTTMSSNTETRQVPMGNLLFKIIGICLLAPFASQWQAHAAPAINDVAMAVVTFHLAFNVMVAVLLIGFTHIVAKWVEYLLPKPEKSRVTGRPNHLDPTALATPALAISCAVREAMHQADTVEIMLMGLLKVIHHGDLNLAKELRHMDDTIDEIYSSIKYYLTQIPREALGANEAQRWADILSFTINMEQIGDILERVIQDVEDKKIKPGRDFSEAGLAEICELHSRLVRNLRLGMSVFLSKDEHEAQHLLIAKANFNVLEREYAATHLTRLSANTVQSIETSSLHLDLISDLKRINSHICSVAYSALTVAQSGKMHTA
ncbi:Na/Pi cotransporter family protein [Rhodoferax aquaticus]|uniref:Na/Pi cotransporter family protein n=1 Tax=Rhodoferax aquaticus TaxID=2527691 RepID=A0A515EL00_9BURK|nr:Na/Pi cotransporter family protein [Rhodoferax aquaticus]QDL53338.1 Na/Pi cotransporter family protein [Rhodoferax aquaticus]